MGNYKMCIKCGNEKKGDSINKCKKCGTIFCNSCSSEGFGIHKCPNPKCKEWSANSLFLGKIEPS